MIKRIFDLIISFGLILISLIPIFIIYLLLWSNYGSTIYWSDRIGKDNKIFKMPKFKTMTSDTPEVASDLLMNPEQYITKIGRFLRLYSLDELPQFWSVIKGDMSLVGPRPALFNQHELISMRSINNVHKVKPGITGWAQINGRDTLSIEEKVNFDIYYVNNQSFKFDIKIIFLTFLKIMNNEGVYH
jgi:O-antigen biosynthesis protein WbqP